jgi:WD40 repeat protein
MTHVSGWIAALAVAAFAQTTDPPGAPAASPEPLPPRARLRIGTDLLRTPGNIRSFALSPDGRLVAAGDLNPPSPRITIFEVRTGRRSKQLVAPRHRQVGWVETVTFSPDGTKLLWGEESGEVALWDLSADRLLFRRQLHQGNVAAEVFSPDGRMFASGGYDGVIHLRRVERPEENVRDFTLPTLAHLAFSPDGRRLVAGGQFSTMIAVWDAGDGRLQRQFGPTADTHLKSMAVTPDGRQILSAGYRKEAVARTEVRLWDIETGARIRDLGDPEEIGFGDVALSPDGRKMAIVNFRGLRMLDASNLEPHWSVDLPGWWGRPVVFSSDGKLVALADQNAIAVFETATGRRLHHDRSTPVGRVGAVAWSPSGERIVTGHSDGFVRLWDAATGKLIWHKLLAPIVTYAGQAADPHYVGSSRNGKLLVAAGYRDDPASRKDVVVVYEAATGEVAREIPQGLRLTAPSPDGRMVVAATDNAIVGIEAVTGRRRWTTPTVNKPDSYVEPAALQFEANPTWFDAALKDGHVIRYNVLTGHEQRRFLADGRMPEQRKVARAGNPVLSTAAFSADGRTLATSSAGWICVWDVAAGTLRRRIRYPHARDCWLALSPDGKTLATADLWSQEEFGEDKIRLYDVETGELVLTLEPGEDRADVLAFSPDGSRLLTGSQRGSALVWDVRRPPRASKP